MPKNVGIERPTEFGSQKVTARPISASIRPIVTTSLATRGASVSRRISTRSMAAPNNGAKMNTVMSSANGSWALPQSTFSCQYTNALNMPIAPWAKLKMPDVV